MSAIDKAAGARPRSNRRFYQGFRNAPRSYYYRNEVAQRHRYRSRLFEVRDGSQYCYVHIQSTEIENPT